MSRYRIIYAGLMVSALYLLSATPAAAVCSHKSTVYNTGTLTGTGNTCADAQASLEGNLFGTADANCQAIYGDNAGIDTHTESLNSCVQNGVGKLQTGSMSYTCVVCVCFAPRCQ
jgi:hypothetical protein